MYGGIGEDRHESSLLPKISKHPLNARWNVGYENKNHPHSDLHRSLSPDRARRGHVNTAGGALSPTNTAQARAIYLRTHKQPESPGS